MHNKFFKIIFKSFSVSSGSSYFISKIFSFELKAGFLKASSYKMHPRDHIILESSDFSPFKISGL